MFYSTFLSADEYTLRKRGLLVAAVLFITGIVILTSKTQSWGRPQAWEGGGFSLDFDSGDQFLKPLLPEAELF